MQLGYILFFLNTLLILLVTISVRRRNTCYGSDGICYVTLGYTLHKHSRMHVTIYTWLNNLSETIIFTRDLIDTALLPGTEVTETSTCQGQTAAWSPCSVSCGMGVSVRMSTDNADCRPHQQRRLCLVRPCELSDKHFVSMIYPIMHRSQRKSIVEHDVIR